MLGSRDERVEVADHVLKRDRLLHLAQPERGLERQLHRHDQPRAPQPGERRVEERALLVARAGHELAACEQHGERHDVAREHLELDPSPVRRGGDDAAECLCRNRAEVVHGEAVHGELLLEVDEGDACFCNDVAFLNVDLGTCQSQGQSEKKR